MQPEWLSEHIQQGHPTEQELSGLLPGALITGSENCPTWVRFASLNQRAFLWLFAGLYYVAALHKKGQSAAVSPGPVAVAKGRGARAIEWD